MANIQERYGKLVVDFRYKGKRCRETTNLEANASNRRMLKKRLEQMEAEITLGTFDYAALLQIAIDDKLNILLAKSSVYESFPSSAFSG